MLTRINPESVSKSLTAGLDKFVQRKIKTACAQQLNDNGAIVLAAVEKAIPVVTSLSEAATYGFIKETDSSITLRKQEAQKLQELGAL